MATFKTIILPHQKKIDGTINVKIRLTHCQKSKYISTPFFLTSADYSKGMKIKNQGVLDQTEDMIRLYRKRCNDLGIRLASMDVEQVFDLIANDPNFETFQLDFFEFARKKITEMEASGRANTASTYKSTIRALADFLNQKQLDISGITAQFLSRFVAWLGDKQRATSLYTSNIRTLHNQAKMEYNDEDMGIIRIPQSPFNKFKVPPQRLTRKRALSPELIRRMVRLPDNAQYPRYNLARDVYILSFALLGMNSIDLYSCPAVKDGRLTYQRSKTKGRRADHAEISVRIEPEIMQLVEKYKDPSGKKAFVFYQHYAEPSNFNAALNKGLKLIGKELEIEDLEFYSARHSWATIAANSVGIDKYTVHTALNHVDPSMKVTDIYIDRDWGILDKANRAVLDFMRF